MSNDTSFLSDPSRDRLIRVLSEGEVLVREGDAPHAAFLVLSGEIKLFRIAEGGRLRIVGLCRPGDMVGHARTARGEPMACSAYASRETVLQVVGEDHFDHGSPEAGFLPRLVTDEDADVGAADGDVATRAAYVSRHGRRRAPRGRESGLKRAYWRLRRRMARDRGASPEILDEIEVLETRKDPWRSTALLVLLLTIIGSFITWAALSEIDVVVTAEGRLQPTQGQAVVAPLETGTLREMKVKPGDRVREGQEIATLDPTFALADLTKAREQEAVLQARARRLEAQLRGVVPERFSDDPELEALNRDLYRTHRQEIASRERTRAAKLAEIDTRLATRRDELEAVQEQIAIFQDVEDMRSDLFNDKIGSRLQLLEARGKIAALERDVVQFRRSIAEMQSQKETIEAEHEVFLAQLNQDSVRQLEQTHGDLSRVRQELRKAERLNRLVSLEAPADAVVLSVAEEVPGAVVNQGTPLVTLTPIDGGLQVTALLQPQDVANVHVGQRVRVKLDALPFQKHGTLTGELRVLSSNIVTDRTPGSEDLPEQERRVGYRMIIDITDDRLENVNAGFALLPGMKTVAELQVGKRNVLSYFLYPMLRVFDESLRER